MKKYDYSKPSPRLLKALQNAEEIKKNGFKAQDVNIVLAQLKLACVK